MNDSCRTINEDIKEILSKAKRREPAFDGTVKKGFKRRFTIINEADVNKYLTTAQRDVLNDTLNLAFHEIELGRQLEGKKPFNNYIVINLDEPYVDEIIEIMKRHGHWG